MIELGIEPRKSGAVVVAPWSRVAILVFSLVILCATSFLITGSIIPASQHDALIFQSALLVIVLGSALLEHKFTKPADSLVNALMGVVTLVTVYGRAPKTAWWLVFAYCGLVLVLATVCTAASTGPYLSGWREIVARRTYEPAVFLGRARLLYSIVFLFGVFSFYGLQDARTAVLVVFWGTFIALWPLGVPEFLSGLRREGRSPVPIGRVVRTDFPNLIRVALQPNTSWQYPVPKVYQQPDGRQSLVIPLYKQFHEQQLLGTGLCIPCGETVLTHLSTDYLYESPSSVKPTEAEISAALGGDPTSQLIGFVVEDTTIGQMRFETWRTDLCREGLLIWCRIGEERIFYQITDGVTREESLESERRGYQVAVAGQLGVLHKDAGFRKYAWLPVMNSPVFCEAPTFGAALATAHEGDFVYGTVPGTKIRIGGPFAKFMDHHTAILGVTGSGKTELAFDLIRYTVDHGVKVVCIDLTARYEKRLKDLKLSNLSISGALSDELGKKLFEVETGKYGAGDEKKALKTFSDKLRADVEKAVREFLTAKTEDKRIGIITLDEISNTKATLYITELFLTCLLHFARDNQKDCPRILIVVEEAHTVMPEATTMGLGDYDSRGTVGKISQIALQGRKYGVGLLVVAQRTATVSKTVLTQCNTVITLNCFDETSIGFLENVYGESHSRMVSNLPRLHAVIFGKAVRSERPIMVAIPYSKEKEEVANE